MVDMQMLKKYTDYINYRIFIPTQENTFIKQLFMKKNILFFTRFLFVAIPIISNAQSAKKDVDYHPLYWYEGIFDHKQKLDEASLSAKIDDVVKKGWHYVTFWGADRKGKTITYYFKSPFLEKQSWAVSGGDGLTRIVKGCP